jgi:hypothetical protein
VTVRGFYGGRLRGRYTAEVVSIRYMDRRFLLGDIGLPISGPADVAETVWYNADSAQPLTVNKPSLFGSGQLLIAVITQHVASGSLADLTGPSGWTQQGSYDATGSEGKVWSHIYDGTEPATWNFGYNTTADVCLGLFRVVGVDTTPVIVVASTAINSGTSPEDSPTVTPTGPDDLLICLLAEFCNGTVLTETDPASMTDLGQTQVAGNFMALAAAKQQLASGSPTGVRTWTSITPIGFPGGTFSIAIKSLAAASTSIPWNPQRFIISQDPGRVPWLQHDSRDANTLATPANPLPTPLDAAWQAGGRYWHLYGDAAGVAPRGWSSYQRPLVSDPGLLATAATDPLTLAAGVGGDTWRRYNTPAFGDRREAPAQRPYTSDPLLLTTALLENELLGGMDDLRRRWSTPAYADRRQVPQQRAYVSDPILLTTALLEPPLLAAPDDLRRHVAVADWYDRRQVPQQRLYVSDPLILTTAQLENELLGGADDRVRHLQAALFVDRREVPQQRAYVSDPLLLGTALLEDTLLGGLDDLRRHGWTADFYDRREVPQQRNYVSDPLLLTAAELENELLGGADGARRYATPATHAARWWMPEQPRRDATSPGLLDSALLDDLLGSADDLRRRSLVASTHADRRVVPQQPNRSTLYFDAGDGSPPLTLAFGDGGAYWALYNQAAWQPDRRETPQQRAYISDPAFYPLIPPTDPLTLAWGAGGTYWLLYNGAAANVDRRLVPQQRRYQSDPELLSSALLENELLGWSDTARHQLAAAYTDRREVPQQRPYVSDPALFASALLENELLGGADTLRRYLAAAYTDRREVPQQRAYVSDPALLLTALLEDGLLGGADDLRRRVNQAALAGERRGPGGYQPRWPDPALFGPGPTDPLAVAGGVGGDTWRRANIAAYADRRAVPAQPPRVIVYFDAGPDVPPLTLSWGAGGTLWHLYNRVPAARAWWPLVGAGKSAVDAAVVPGVLVASATPAGLAAVGAVGTLTVTATPGRLEAS